MLCCGSSRSNLCKSLNFARLMNYLFYLRSQNSAQLANLHRNTLPRRLRLKFRRNFCCLNLCFCLLNFAPRSPRSRLPCNPQIHRTILRLVCLNLMRNFRSNLKLRPRDSISNDKACPCFPYARPRCR